MKESFYIAAGSLGTFSRYLDSRRARPRASRSYVGMWSAFWNDLAAPLTRGVKSAGPPGGERQRWATGAQLAEPGPGGFGSFSSPSLSLSVWLKRNEREIIIRIFYLLLFFRV